jgi:MFS-type transporter involved in bile tolerance (Atg22 family)
MKLEDIGQTLFIAAVVISTSVGYMTNAAYGWMLFGVLLLVKLLVMSRIEKKRKLEKWIESDLHED